MLKAIQCNDSSLLLKHERLTKYIEVKYKVNLKRFCYHLLKTNKIDFLHHYITNPSSFQIQRELSKAHKIIGMNINEALQVLCIKLPKTEYILFVQNMSFIYKHEKIMFIKHA